MKRILAIALAALALTLLFSTCNKLVPTTVDECIDNFMSDISSSDRSEVYKNLDSDGAMYNQVKAAGYWDNPFPVDEIPYTLSGKTTSDNYVYAKISSSDVGFGSKSIVFVMSTDSDGNAVIRSIAFTSPPKTVYN